MPISSNLCPSIAPFKKLTEERSGSFKLASPPTSSLPCAKAGAPLSSAKTPAAAPPNLVGLHSRPKSHSRDQPFASQVFINDPPSKFRAQGCHRSLECLTGTPIRPDAVCHQRRGSEISPVVLQLPIPSRDLHHRAR